MAEFGRRLAPIPRLSVSASLLRSPATMASTVGWMNPRALDPSRPSVGVATLVGAFAFMLGMVRIGTKSVWFDEAVSADFADRSFPDLLPQITGGDPNMSLYYVLLNLWRRMFGDSEFALRSMSALAGAGAVVAVYVLGTRLFSRRTGTFAALLLAVSPFMIQYAQTARGYTLVAFLVTLSCHFFVCELARPSVGVRVAYVLVSVAAVYVHYFAALVLIAQLCALAMHGRRPRMTSARISMAVAVIVLCVPAVIFARAGGTSRIDWIPPLKLVSVPGVIVKMAGESDTLTALFCLAGVWAIWRIVSNWRLEGDRSGQWALRFVVLWVAVPFVIAFGVSLRRPLFLAQYLIVCLPALCLMSAAALSAIDPRKHGTWLVALCSVVSLVRVGVLYRAESNEDWRSAERYVSSQRRLGDEVAFFPEFSKKGFAYYAKRNGLPMSGSAYRRTELGSVYRPTDSARRVWLIIRNSDTGRLERRLALQRAELGVVGAGSERARFPNIRIELFEPREPAAIAR